MFIGHHAAAFALKPLAPRVSLGTLFGATLLLDLLWPLANLTSPPPPSARAIAWVGLAQWLFVPWGYWIDRHRQVRS